MVCKIPPYPMRLHSEIIRKVSVAYPEIFQQPIYRQFQTLNRTFCSWYDE